jgi:arylsulfatase A-like enzyme
MRQSNNPHNATSDEISIPPPLSPTIPTLPELLADCGYRTYGGFGFEMPFLALSGRFERHNLYTNVPASRVTDQHESWLFNHQSERTFSYLHLSDAHQPLTPPPGYIQEFCVDTSIDGLSDWRYTDDPNPTGAAAEYVDHRQRLYWAAIRYVDDVLSSYYHSIVEQLSGDVLFIITGDHSEGFWEHAAFDAEYFIDSRPAYCVGHGGTPYECITRVPLLMNSSSEGDSNFHTTTPERSSYRSLIDVAPTLLDAVGIDSDHRTEMSGHTLFGDVPADRPVIVEDARYGYEKKAIYWNGWKLLRSQGDETTIGFALAGEQPASIPTAIRSEMEAYFPQWPNQSPDAETGGQTISRTVEQRLNDLGYR